MAELLLTWQVFKYCTHNLKFFPKLVRTSCHDKLLKADKIWPLLFLSKSTMPKPRKVLVL